MKLTKRKTVLLWLLPEIRPNFRGSHTKIEPGLFESSESRSRGTVSRILNKAARLAQPNNNFLQVHHEYTISSSITCKIARLATYDCPITNAATVPTVTKIINQKRK